MTYYPETASHIRDKELEHATGVDTFDSAAKKDFITLKAKVDTLDIDKLANVPTNLNYLKTKLDDLDVVKLKTIPVVYN